MEGNTPFPYQSSYKTPVIFALVRSLGDDLQTEWFNFVLDFTNDRLNRLTGGNPPRRTHIHFIMYCRGSLISVVPSHDWGGDDVVEKVPMNDTITQDSIAFYGYESIIEMVKDFQKGPKQDPNEQFSYHLWHIAAAKYPHFDVSPAPWDPEWNMAYSKLRRLDINLSMILINPCPNLWFFSARTYIPPWVSLCDDCPHHTILSSGFVPPSELGGVMPCTVTAGHPISSSSVPSAMVGVPLVTLLHSPHISAAHGTHYMTGGPWLGPPIYQCMGSGSHMQVPATGPVLNQHESTQYISPAVVQIQPQFNSNDTQVPGAQGQAPVHECVSRHGSGVEQQQPMSHDYTGASSASGYLANTNAGNTMLWTGTLFLNGVCTRARAPKTESVRDPKLSAWPNILDLECVGSVAARNTSTLDIQAWMHRTAAPLVRIHGTDSNFEQLVGDVRNGGDYAIVKWDDLARLLLVPVGDILLCAAFPDKGISDLPEPQPQKPIRVLGPSEKKTKKKKKTSPGSQSDPAATETRPDGPHVEAAESITPTQSQPEQPQVAYCDQNTDACSIRSSADSSSGGILITDSEAMEDSDLYEYVDSDDEST